MTKKAELSVPKAKYDKAVAALQAGLAIISDMDKAGALRLPFPGFPEVVATMRAAVKK